jgi:hypothetical protein
VIQGLPPCPFWMTWIRLFDNMLGINRLENPVVKLPGMALTYIKGHDRDTAIYFDGKTYLREPALTFVPAGKNWIEGTVGFWVKPESSIRAYLKRSDGYIAL